MTLEAGSLLGPYEIVAPLGKGGMGEVYRGRDTRLERSVAIKVVTEALSQDPQYRERLTREARIISQLQHPNICTLHDVGEQGGLQVKPRLARVARSQSLVMMNSGFISKLL